LPDRPEDLAEQADSWATPEYAETLKLATAGPWWPDVNRFFGEATNMSVEGLLIFLVIGLIAGWLAGQIMRGGGFGLIGDIVVGVIGAFIAGFLLPRLGIHLGSGFIEEIINALIGAVILLFVLRLIKR
jgi:uncharacterized membrane protein YeaQ/YmgE (transglycosylase-associated protein family)